MRRKLLLAVTVIFSVICVAAVAFAAEPGSDGDPLVTKSYIDSIVSELKSFVEEKIDAAISGNINPDEDVVMTNESFQVVRLAENQRITFGESAELILRMGRGVVIASEKGGIADVTKGCDLADGEEIEANHLLIVPIDDGRGFEAQNDVLVMVKGSYKIN